MAHFAQIDENNIVTQVIVVSDDDCAGGNFPESEVAGAYFCNKLLGGTWKQTSYNINFRKNFAGIGYTYDRERDAFIPPKPFDSWVLNEDTCLWDAPVAMPDDGGMYQWDESTTSWVAVEQEQP
jgi:hypothetical protein